MHRTLLLAATGILLGAALATAPSADAGGRKLLQFQAGTFQCVVAGAGARKSTNYVLDYKVTNATDAAVRPRIRFEVRTDTGKVHGDAYDAPTAAAAAKDLRLKAPPPSTATLRGADLDAGATASGLACFGAVDPHARVLEIRVSGLTDRVYRDPQGRVWAENRVLVLTFDRPGDEYDRHLDRVTLRSAKEIVDGERVQVRETK